MKIKSILVPIDGSKDALNASVVAWQLAKNVKARISALSIIDTQSIWTLLGQKLSGLIGSGPFIAGYENIYASLRNISDALLMAFETRSQGYGIQTECMIGEGNIAEVLLEHAGKHDLVVMGRRPKYQSINGHTFIKTSLSHKIACDSPVPVLIVSSEPRSWTRARLIFDSQSFNLKQLEDFMELAQSLNLEAELFCCDDATDLEADIRKYVPNEIPLLSHDPAYGDDAWRAAIDVNSSTVLMLLTTKTDEGRELSSGPSVSTLIKALPAVSFCVFPPQPAVDKERPAAPAKKLQLHV
ncbi:MAG TPA: universal stress protein [Oculatellaceae cyanobacterium]